MPSSSAQNSTNNGSTSSSSSKVDPKSLPPKENALFKRILKCYEQKQYKNGLKFAKQILSNPKYSEHGETLAMKGLTLNCLGRKEEAYDYVRRGLRNDLKSHVCWHVYGLLQRSDKKYDEAIKCYRNALKWDKDNIQILRDLSLLQIQMRDLDGYKDTRYQLFQLRPTQRASWIGFAMSYHLLSDHDMALKILEEFRKTQQGVNREVVGQVMQALYNKKAAYDYEHSELLLYQNSVLQESGDVPAALQHLERYREQICDKGTFLETKGALLLKGDRHAEAEAIFAELIRRNPENHEYYRQMEVASKCTEPSQKLEMYSQYREKYPRAQAPQRLPLDIAPAGSPEFRSLVDRYLRKALSKGVPPVFVELRPLYKDDEKVTVIQDLCLSYLENLRGPKKCYDATESNPVREPATAELWLLYYLAQHYDYLGDYPRALTLVEEAIEHTPTLIELFTLKGKIFKHVGDMGEAVRWMDEAQSLDTADRYINCKCAKYMLMANQVKPAEDMCAKFTREGVAPSENLNEMQCMWFQTEAAAANRRLGKWGEAIKKCIEVDRHFTEIIEDQFDFHTYCMRKMTLRSYVDLLRLEDVLRSHKFYERAAHTAIEVYLRLHDHPVTDTDAIGDADVDAMDPSELKKLRNKQKKAKRKAEQEKQQQQQQQAKKDLHNKSQKKGGDGNANSGDAADAEAASKDDLLPERLERPEDPLAEAVKFLVPLQQLASGRVRTHVLAFEIAFRKRRPLLMLQSVRRALRTPSASEDDPEVHGCLVRLQRFVEERRSEFPAAVAKVLDREENRGIFKSSSKERNEQFLKRHADSLPHVFVGAKMLHHLDPSQSERAVKAVTKREGFTKGVDLKTCSDILDVLTEGGLGPAATAEAAEAFKQECSGRFPLAVKFKPASELKRQEEEEGKKSEQQQSEEEHHIES